MPLTATYADLNMFQNRFNGGASLPAVDATQMLMVLERASRSVDGACNRSRYGFGATSETVVFDGTGRDPNNVDYLNWATRSFFTQSMSYLRIPDLISAGTVALDLNSSRAFATVLSPASDYYLLNEGAINQDAPPFNKLQLDIFNGTVTVFSSRPRLVRITGVWGYGQDTEPVSVTGTLTDAVTTTLTVSSATNDLAAGQTLLAGAEQVYVTAGSGTTWTVRRGQNGTSAAAATGATLSRYTYVPAVREAALRIAELYARSYGKDQLVETSDGGAKLRQINEESQRMIDAYDELDRYRRVFI